MRRLVVCLDGTWGNETRLTRSDRDHWVYKPSNVLKTFRAVLPTDAAGVAQISYYDEGVGGRTAERNWFSRALARMDRLFGGLAGAGFEEGVRSAYRFLAGNYLPGDQIYVFGFSRGAGQAQSLCRFVDWVGGLLHKRDEYYLPSFWDRFRDSRARAGEAARLREEIRSRDERRRDVRILDPQPVEIALLGVFDTVLALGSRLGADRAEGGVPTVAPADAFHVGAAPPGVVRRARQALAIDERRWDFRPQIWLRPAAPEQSLAQLWFPGVHTNVGGGYPNDGLANGALHWMAGEARAAGLSLDDRFLRHYRPWAKDERYDSSSPGWKFIESLRGKRGRGQRALAAGAEAGIDLHDSVYWLLQKEPTYRPRNLLEYLRTRTDLRERLPADLAAAPLRPGGD